MSEAKSGKASRPITRISSGLRGYGAGLFDIVNLMVRAGGACRVASARLVVAIAIIRLPARGDEKHLENRHAGSYGERRRVAIQEQKYQ